MNNSTLDEEADDERFAEADQSNQIATPLDTVNKIHCLLLQSSANITDANCSGFLNVRNSSTNCNIRAGSLEPEI